MYNSNTDIWMPKTSVLKRKRGGVDGIKQAGALAAITVDFVVYPFDTLKTRMQSPDYEKQYKDARTGAIRRHVLFKGVYQGVWTVVLSAVPASGAFFTTYEAVKHILSEDLSHNDSDTLVNLPLPHSLPNPIAHAIASSTAEMVSCLMLTPAEVLKQNAQVIQKQTGSGEHRPTATLEVISRFKHKPWKLWRGYAALVGRNLPFTGLHFPIFEFIRSHVVEWRDAKKKDGAKVTRQEMGPVLERAVLTGFSAAMSGTIAAVVTTPIDVVKTRVMLAASNGAVTDPTSSEKIGTRGALDVGKEIYQNEGVRGLFRGGFLRAGWTAVSLGLYLSIYEGGRFHLENRRKDRDHEIQMREERVVI